MCDNLAYEQDKIWDEMINGEIVLMSPRPAVNHLIISGNIHRSFANQLRGKTSLPLGAGADVYLAEEDRFIPDVMIICDRSIIKQDGIHGVPDLVVEILSPRSVKYDRGHKKDIYEKCGVKEYWIVDPKLKSVEVYFLKEGKFVLDKIYEYISSQGDNPIKVSVCDNVIVSLAEIFENTF